MLDRKLTRYGQRDVVDAFWAIVTRRIPLAYGRDRLFVSLEAWPWLKAYLRDQMTSDSMFIDMVLVDDGLVGVEMRLESRCRP